MSDSQNPNKSFIDKLVEERKKHLGESVPSTLVSRLIKGDRQALSEAITLVESEKAEQNKLGQEILKETISDSGKSIRIGITGVPGVGKSTFIESFGYYLAEMGKKVAVLAIDPSSKKSGGSILGDKTRMTKLSVHPNAFIRPSATGGSLGGVAQKTRETILLCEAAGFDVILVETVGVGQSEIAVHSMTDFFLLLMLAGAGDELQGIKRGIMEMADSIVITKTDGDNVQNAKRARSQYKNALHLFPPTENGWIPKVETVSALENKNIDAVWEIISSYRNKMMINGYLEENRKRQKKYWMRQSLNDAILHEFYSLKGMEEYISQIEEKLENEEITSYQASSMILKFYHSENK